MVTEFNAALELTERIDVILITDPGKDLDDEQALVLLGSLCHAGIVNLKAVVANLEPALERAKLVKGTLNLLGLSDVPVGIGTDCFTGGEKHKYETDVSYANAVPADELCDGYELLTKVLEGSAPRSVTLIIIGGMTDAAGLMMRNAELFVSRVAAVVLMGGVRHDKSAVGPEFTDGPDDVKYLTPSDAANNAFDWPAALYLYQALQEKCVPMTVVTRWAAYAAQFPFTLYDRFEATGNPIGAGLLRRQKPAINQLWKAASSPEDSPARGRLPMSRDRQWFVGVFCKGIDPGIGMDDEVWPYCLDYFQYDSVTIAAAIGPIRDRYFNPITVNVRGVEHRIIGLSQQEPGVTDGTGLGDLISHLQIEALSRDVCSF